MIRPAVAGDAPAVVALSAEGLGRDGWPPVMVEEGIRGVVPHLTFLVEAPEGAEGGEGDDGGGPTAYVAVSVVREVAELQQVVVGPAHRRTGRARALLAAADEHARTAGAQRMVLEVRETNEAALALYRAHGYVELSRRPRYYRDGADAVVLELLL